MKKLRAYHILTAYFMLCSLSSCSLILEYPEECEDVGLTIVNDWSLAPDADPEGMTYLFFTDTGEKWRFDFPGRGAGRVRLPEGRYSFVSCNDDSFRTIIEGDSYSSLRACTRSVSLPGDAEGCREAFETPDMLWGCGYHAVSLTYTGLTYFASAFVDGAVEATHSPKRILTARQRRITPRYRIRVEDVENLSGVRRMSGALSGMAVDYRFATGRPDDAPAALSFGARPADGSTIGCEFRTFGLTGREEVRNIFYLFVTLTDGRGFVYSFDVTGQVRGAPDPMDVTVVLRGLVIERSEPGAGGAFDVDVDGWTTVDVNITD